MSHCIRPSLLVATLIAVALFASLAPQAGAAGAKKPNILWLHADDQRPDTIHALGNPAIVTPTLDALAGRGMSFKNAYNFGGNSPAVCTPSRNMMLSGRAYFRYSRMENPKTGETFRPDPADRMAAVTIEAKQKAGFKWNILAPGDAPNVPLSLAAAGYQTYHHGKKGNTATNIQAKFEINKYLKDDQQERLSGEPGKEIVDAAIEFLSDRKDERPFAMYLAFGNPHDPRVAASEYLAKYDRSKIPLPPNYRPTHPFNNGELTVRDERLAPWPRTEDEIRKQLHEYYAVITAFDHHLGRLLKTLEERGLAENTIVLFTADQGLAMGSHGLMGKQNLYDGSTKLPMILAGPGIKPGTSEALVYLFDVYPTLCELVGAEAPAGIDGRSFAGVLGGGAEKHRDVIFAAYQSVQRMIRDERYKLIRYPQVDRTQLFDVVADPYEIKNLADDLEQAERVKAMLALMKTQQQHYGDWLPLKVAHPQPAKFDFTNVPPEPKPKKK